MKRIALITPMLQPYRITFYEKLASFDLAYQWKVFHGVRGIEDGRPGYQGETGFQNEGFQENKYTVGPFTIVHNKGLFIAVREFNPDLVIVQSITGDISNRRVVNWARRQNIKIVGWTCGWEPGNAKGALLLFKNSLVSAFYKKADLHLTYSTNGGKYAESMGVSPEYVRNCYNGIEIDHLLDQEERIIAKSKELIKRYKLDGFITFLYVGGLIPKKRIDLLLTAFKELSEKYSNIKLLIIGDGPFKEQVLAMIREIKNPNIHYLGRIIDDVDAYFAASDCLVLPGIGGLALNQGMFWRKTCIVSEADGTEDDLVIENETGYRFKKDRLESLKNAMERRINTHHADLLRMSEKAREIIETKSNVNNMVHVFSKAVKELLEA